MDVARQALEILDRRLNELNSKFKTLEEFTLDENDNIHKNLDGRKAAEVEVKETITFLECRVSSLVGRFMDMMEAMNARVKTLKEDVEEGRYATTARERADKIEASKPPIFKDVDNA